MGEEACQWTRLNSSEGIPGDTRGMYTSIAVFLID